jgi:hypothetical protein
MLAPFYLLPQTPSLRLGRFSLGTGPSAFVVADLQSLWENLCNLGGARLQPCRMRFTCNRLYWLRKLSFCHSERNPRSEESAFPYSV